MSRCRYCNSTNLIKQRVRNGRQQLLCNDCNRYQMEIDERIKIQQDEVDLAIIAYALSKSARFSTKVLEKITNKKYSCQAVCNLLHGAGIVLNDRNSEINKFHEKFKAINVDDIQDRIEKGALPEGTGILISGDKAIFLKIKDKRKKKKKVEQDIELRTL